MNSQSDTSFLDDKYNHFLGNVKIGLDQISFDSISRSSVDLISHPDVDAKHVSELATALRASDERLDPSTYVPAIVDALEFQQYLAQFGIDKNQLGNPRDGLLQLRLPDKSSLLCLHGKHRIAAAKSLFSGEQRWWVVALYSNSTSQAACFITRPAYYDTLLISHDPELSPSTVEYLRESYAHGRTVSDGEVYRWIHFYEKRSNPKGVERWMNRLSNSKQKNGMQRLGKTQNQWLHMRLGKLVLYHGLWADFHFGTFPTICSWKFEEVWFLRHLQSVSPFLTSNRSSVTTWIRCCESGRSSREMTLPSFRLSVRGQYCTCSVLLRPNVWMTGGKCRS